EVPFTREAPKREDQSPILNGGPHEGRDTVTQSDTQMAEQVVVRETQFLSKKSDVQLANANLQSAHEFEQSSPKLAKALRQSGIKQFEIAGIDGIQVASAFELAKVLGRCRECQITAIHVRESQPERFVEQRMQSIAAARNLVLLIEANSVLRNSGRLLDDATKLYDLLAQIWSDDQIKVSGYQINVQAKELFSKVSSELNKYYLQDSIQENLYVLLSDPFLLMLP
ncbi:MAG TPA: hypothetical protein PLU50_07780, partial [Pseudobdellovibrionaceae bacterium]|nr:hypothetical protein [Pseudobdellovibrionaceae bacterium]